jgi:hypothetical protein
MKKVVIAVGIILAVVVLYVGSYYGTRAFTTPNDSQLIDQIITLQEKQQEILTTAQRNLAENIAPTNQKLNSYLKRLNIVDRTSYEKIMATYFPNDKLLPDPNAKASEPVITPAPESVAPETGK